MSEDFSRQELKKIARFHKFLLWSILIAIISNVFRFYLTDQALGLYFYFGAAGFQIYSLYNLARALKRPVVWVIILIFGLLIPIVGLILLLSLHGNAMEIMKTAGIKVGFMGADLGSI